MPFGGAPRGIRRQNPRHLNKLKVYCPLFAKDRQRSSCQNVRRPGTPEVDVDPMGRPLDRRDALIMVGPRADAEEHTRRTLSSWMGGIVPVSSPR